MLIRSIYLRLNLNNTLNKARIDIINISESITKHITPIVIRTITKIRTLPKRRTILGQSSKIRRIGIIKLSRRRNSKRRKERHAENDSNKRFLHNITPLSKVDAGARIRTGSTALLKPYVTFTPSRHRPACHGPERGKDRRNYSSIKTLSRLPLESKSNSKRPLTSSASN